MDETTLFWFLVLVFGAVFFLANSIFVPTMGAGKLESDRLRQRLGSMVKEHQFDGAASLLREKYLKTLRPIERVLEALPLMRRLESLIEQSGTMFPAYRLVLFCFLSGVIAALGVWLATHSVLYAFGALLLGAWLPVMWYQRKRDRRMEMFEEQLPDALDMMTRALRAGHPFTETLRMVANELGDPISKEFGMTFDEINYGVDVRVAFQNMLIRVPSVSLLALTTSVVVQRESGGNLAEILQKISSVIRGRFRFQRKIRTLTAEGRMSAWVLAMVPLVLFAMLSISNPGYLDILFVEPLGKKILSGAVVLAIIGAFWIRKLLRFAV